MQNRWSAKDIWRLWYIHVKFKISLCASPKNEVQEQMMAIIWGSSAGFGEGVVITFDGKENLRGGDIFC